MAKNFLQMSFSIAQISQITNLNINILNKDQQKYY